MNGDLLLGNLPPNASAPLADSSWLYDILCYGVYSALGGGALVGVKALAVAAIAMVLMGLGRIHGWWLPAALTTLAVLAMGTRLLLQPATFAYLLFAIVLVILRRRDDSPMKAPAGLVACWPLVLLMVIWTNLSGGWLLGLIVIACFGLGRLLDDSAQPGNRLRSLVWGIAGWMILAGACLLNPRFWPTLEWLLPQLRWLGIPAALPEGERIVSPFESDYWSTFGRVPVGLAYYPLLGLSLLSFFLNVRRWQWRWFLPWLALAVLSAVQARVVPFFAVLAAPVAAWNFQELFAAHAEDPRRWSLRVLTVGLAMTFLAGAWPGWLQLPPYEPRHWAIDLPPSLVHSADACRRWHEQGKLTPAAKGLHLSRDTACVFAWICPQETGVWDEALMAPFLGLSKAPDDFLKRLRDAAIHHIIVHHSDRDRLFAALTALGTDSRQWPLLYLEGDVAIFGWRDPTKSTQADPFAGWEMDLQQLALHPPSAKQAPPHRPARDAESRRWWDALHERAPPRSFDRDEASVYLLRAESLRLTAPFRHLTDWEAGQVAALAGVGPGWSIATCLLDAPFRLEVYRPRLEREAEQTVGVSGLSKWVLVAQRNFTFQRDDCPPENLYLAIRAARRAVGHNPQDAHAWLILGDCYLRLRHHTRERIWGQRLQELTRLRHAQASEALNQAILLKPDLLQAQFKLAELYLEMGYLDLALQHRRAHFALLPKPGSGPDDRAERQRRDQLSNELEKLTKTVEELEQWHAQNAAGLLVLERARMAAHKGLAGKARQLLVDSDVAAFGPQGMSLELELLLRTGRAKDVREWTGPELESALGAGNFRWLRVQAFAASGDYALADQELASLASHGRREGMPSPRDSIALMVGQQAALESRVWAYSIGELIRRVLARTVFLDRVGDLAQMIRQQSDVNVLRGVLALEQGRTEEATAAFRQALAIWNEAGTRGAIDFDARVIAQGWLDKLR